jgi:hypothetical protein
MKVEDSKTVLHRQEDGSGWQKYSTISGYYAFMPTREAKLWNVFKMLAEEYAKTRIPLPA